MNPDSRKDKRSKNNRRTAKAIDAMPIAGIVVAALLVLPGLTIVGGSYNSASAQQNMTGGGGGNATTGGGNQSRVMDMAIEGQWTLHYDWGCGGSYTQVGITFNNDGSFSIPSQNLAGKWVQRDGMILFQFDQFDNIKTTYGGNFAGNAMVGMASTFAGLNGCWYAISVGSTTMLAEERRPEFDASGNNTGIE